MQNHKTVKVNAQNVKCASRCFFENGQFLSQILYIFGRKYFDKKRIF